MGEVYRATDTTLGRDVAVKVLPQDLASDPERRRRFEGEAKAIAALDHPNIVTIYSVEQASQEGRSTPVHFLTMQLVDGQTLSELIPADGLPLEQFFAWAIPLVDAVSAAHRKGITHRDLKPANVMVDSEGRLKVLDFGLAKLQEETGDGSETELPTMHLTEEGQIMGTVAYMSPEQAEGRPVDHRSDLFPLGILLYEMATGERPFQGDSKVSLMASIVKDTPQSVTERNEALPRHLGRIMDRALQKDVTRRHQSALDLRNELEHLRDELTSGDATTPAATERKAVPAVLNRYLYGAVGLTLAAGLVTLIVRQPWATVEAPPGSVAVVYFENLNDAGDSDQLGKMMVTLLTNELARSSHLAVTSSQRIYDIAYQLGRGSGAAIDRSVATEIAERAGVAAMLMGQIGRVGDRFLATTELVEVASGALLASQQAEGETVDDIFSMAAALGADVRRSLRPSTGEPGASDLEGEFTDSVEALRAYLRGEVLMQRVDLVNAVEQFREAVRIDPEFAVAHYRLSLLATWGGRAHGGAASRGQRSRAPGSGPVAIP